MDDKLKELIGKMLMVIVPPMFVSVMTLGVFKGFEGKAQRNVEQSNLLFNVACPVMKQLYETFPSFVNTAYAIIKTGKFVKGDQNSDNLYKYYSDIVEKMQFLDVYYVDDDSVSAFIGELRNFYTEDFTKFSSISPGKQEDLKKKLKSLTLRFNEVAKKINRSLADYLG
ncbi:MAG: hypothetical protein AAGU21_06675 [Solidesulfovibrio sp.]|uniref:hypothetical protein n=1 Tax=Solidesulfovibrio sp. TaxID=2910990 RepID=UPI002B20FB57|nr:hypothetical protein [Solidesulfovibrio sp.]MEA4858792.1 hypothetical protein [Solidesulfovibrio sp.]